MDYSVSKWSNAKSLYRPAESSLSDNEDSDDEDEPRRKKYAFPELDKKIREAVSKYGAVFPKLNFSSPRVRFFKIAFELGES